MPKVQIVGQMLKEPTRDTLTKILNSTGTNRRQMLEEPTRDTLIKNPEFNRYKSSVPKSPASQATKSPGFKASKSPVYQADRSPVSQATKSPAFQAKRLKYNQSDQLKSADRGSNQVTLIK
ncbi:hypothetical protein Bhyg_13197 [Pseudolycoriella hygida]|uniref:Uncharacterized protein n=1 Tax=Pseudolycoriella hygida TaxID=35572 RepID=A0A9Q0MMW1_9DIPT|nr:hypothetical protein Bhyg_13197 [Pseudolycoriella hygida]